MKKYIQPTSEVMKLQMESVIAASFPKVEKGTDAPALGNRRDMWDSDSWTK